MDTLLHQLEADIACRQCGHQVKKPVAWLVENYEYICAMCGETEDLTTAQWKTKVQSYIDVCTEFDV